MHQIICECKREYDESGEGCVESVIVSFIYDSYNDAVTISDC